MVTKRKKVVFFVQGEGRGHLTQALALSEIVRSMGLELVRVFVGTSEHRTIPAYFSERVGAPVVRFRSPNFVMGQQRRGVHVFRSAVVNFAATPMFLRELARLRRELGQCEPDLIVNLYDLLGSLLSLVRRRTCPILALAHQYTFLHRDFVAPGVDPWHAFFVRFYTRLNALRADRKLAISLYPMPPDDRRGITVLPPLLPDDVLRLHPERDDGTILAYLLNPGYAEDLIDWKRARPGVRLVCFWDAKDRPDGWSPVEGLTFRQIDRQRFLEHLQKCRALATTAGFEAIAEGLFLGKAILAVPVVGHLEQELNAADIRHHGLGLTARAFELDRLFEAPPVPVEAVATFRQWVLSGRERYAEVIGAFLREA